MSTDICIHAWPGSYYLEPEKRWIPGKLTLTSLSLSFTADKTGDNLVNFPLSSIIEIKKEASHFIFSSLTVLEKNHTKHWFSALQPNRNVVFSIIEHFWRELLLSQPGAAAGVASSPMTKGKELTHLVACSQKRLEDAAKVLHHQGEQIDGIARDLDKMGSDLDVADRLLTELESPSWWPLSSKFWKIPEMRPREDASTASSKVSGKEGLLLQVAAIISQKAESQVKAGKFTILVSGLEIHDCNSLLMHRFERGDVDDIKVYTPYEISIRQRFIGKPDIAYRLISAKMPQVIPILEMQFSKKMEMLEGASMLQTVKGDSVWQAAPGLMCCTMPGQPPSENQEGALQAGALLISEGDTQELRQILQKLKSLALDTETELERQEEALDGINSAVDHAILTIDKDNRRMRKLT